MAREFNLSPGETINERQTVGGSSMNDAHQLNPYASPPASASRNDGAESSMPPMKGDTVSAATEIVGQPVLAGIWLQTKPLPWYSTYAGMGSVAEFFLMIICAGFRQIFPGRQTETEIRLKHSGPIYCGRTKSDLVFIASINRTKNCHLTHELRRFPLSELRSFDIERAPSTQVDIQFQSVKTLTFHFVGALCELKTFGSAIVENRPLDCRRDAAASDL